MLLGNSLAFILLIIDCSTFSHSLVGFMAMSSKMANLRNSSYEMVVIDLVDSTTVANFNHALDFALEDLFEDCSWGSNSKGLISFLLQASCYVKD